MGSTAPKPKKFLNFFARDHSARNACGVFGEAVSGSHQIEHVQIRSGAARLAQVTAP
jgi:hypothetical protein